MGRASFDFDVISGPAPPRTQAPATGTREAGFRRQWRARRGAAARYRRHRQIVGCQMVDC